MFLISLYLIVFYFCSQCRFPLAVQRGFLWVWFSCNNTYLRVLPNILLLQASPQYSRLSFIIHTWVCIAKMLSRVWVSVMDTSIMKFWCSGTGITHTWQVWPTGDGAWGVSSQKATALSWVEGTHHLHLLVYSCTELTHLMESGFFFFFGFVFMRWSYSPIYLLGTVMGGHKLLATPLEPISLPLESGLGLRFLWAIECLVFWVCQGWAIPGLGHCVFKSTHSSGRCPGTRVCGG